MPLDRKHFLLRPVEMVSCCRRTKFSPVSASISPIFGNLKGKARSGLLNRDAKCLAALSCCSVGL